MECVTNGIANRIWARAGMNKQSFFRFSCVTEEASELLSADIIGKEPFQ